MIFWALIRRLSGWFVLTTMWLDSLFKPHCATYCATHCSTNEDNCDEERANPKVIGHFGQFSRWFFGWLLDNWADGFWTTMWLHRHFKPHYVTYCATQCSTDEDECVEERANPRVISHFGIDLMNFPRSELRNKVMGVESENFCYPINVLPIFWKATNLCKLSYDVYDYGELLIW